MINLFVTPHFHRWYVDEPWALEKAKIFITDEDFSQNVFRHSIGWPFILHFSFRIFGISGATALYTSSVLGALTVFAIFFFSFMLTKSNKIALWAAFIFALIPIQIKYSGSTTSNVSSTFFLIMALAFSFYFYKKSSNQRLLLALSSLGLAAIFRPENYFFIIMFLVGALMFSKDYKKLIKTKYTLFFIIFLILVIPNAIQASNFYFSDSLVYQFDDVEKTWDVNYLFRNKETTSGLINNTLHPILFSALFILGIGIGLKKFRKQTMFLLICTIPIIIPLLFFVMSPPRFLIGLYPFLVILAAMALVFIIDLLSKNKRIITVAVVVIVFLAFIPYIKQVHTDVWINHYLETRIPDMLKADLKESCTIIAPTPTVIKATTSLEVISASDFVEKRIIPSNDCVLFFDDMFCDGTFGTAPECKYIKENYELSEYFEYSYSYKDETKHYHFYKLET